MCKLCSCLESDVRMINCACEYECETKYIFLLTSNIRSNNDLKLLLEKESHQHDSFIYIQRIIFLSPAAWKEICTREEQEASYATWITQETLCQQEFRVSISTALDIVQILVIMLYSYKIRVPVTVFVHLTESFYDHSCYHVIDATFNR